MSPFFLLDECFDYNDDCDTWATSYNCKHATKKALGCQKSCGKCVSKSKDECKDKVTTCKQFIIKLTFILFDICFILIRYMSYQ